MQELAKFKSLISLFTYFKDEQVCRDYLENIRWNGDLHCAYADCKHGKVFKFSNGAVYKCAKCRRKYSVRVGTIFEDSKIPLRKWFGAIYLITSHKKGISSLQLGRDLEVTQKTAWYLLHRVRFSLGLDKSEDKLSGVVEADESFFGGKEANKHANKQTEGTQGRSTKKKTAVAGLVERGGEVRAEKIKDTSGSNLRPFVYRNVEAKSILHTDEWYGYNGLSKLYDHSIVKHEDKEYVKGSCHTNTLEGYWSLVKRGCIGIYHSWSAKHLQKYLDEFSFRYNTRTFSESERFNAMLSNIASTLPYKHLISNEKKSDRITFDHIAGDKQVEVTQGSFGF